MRPAFVWPPLIFNQRLYTLCHFDSASPGCGGRPDRLRPQGDGAAPGLTLASFFPSAANCPDNSVVYYGAEEAAWGLVRDKALAAGGRQENQSASPKNSQCWRELDAVNNGDICQIYSWHRAKGTLLRSAAQKARGSAPGRHLQCLTRDAWRDGGRENGGIQGLIADNEGSEGAKGSVEVQHDGKYLPIIHRRR